MTAATCQVRKPSTKNTDPTTGATTVVNGDVILDVSNCRVQRSFRPRSNPTIEQQIMTEQYVIALPYTDAIITAGDQVEVLTSEDARLIGRTFTVIFEVTGSLAWERDLWTVDNESR